MVPRERASRRRGRALDRGRAGRVVKGDPASRAQGEVTRADIVVAIADGAVRQKEIQDRIGLSLGVVSHHVRRLIAAGRVREATPGRGRIAATYAVEP